MRIHLKIPDLPAAFSPAGAPDQIPLNILYRFAHVVRWLTPRRTPRLTLPFRRRFTGRERHRGLNTHAIYAPARPEAESPLYQQ